MLAEELTPIVASHQNAISRHDIEMAELRLAMKQGAEQHNAAMARLDQQLQSIAQRQSANAEQIQANTQQIQGTKELSEANARQIALSRQDIAGLTASILELRNLVADYIQSRSSQ